MSVNVSTDLGASAISLYASLAGGIGQYKPRRFKVDVQSLSALAYKYAYTCNQ